MEPAEVVRAHVEAVRKGDERAALGWLSPEAQARAPIVGAPMDAPDPTSVAEVGRSATWEGGRELLLVRTAEGWRIRRGVLSLFSADSPEGAMSSLARAIEARDLQRVIDLVPSGSRGLVDPSQLGALIAGHPAWGALARAIIGGHVGWVARERERAEAVVAVGGQEHRLVLVREDGGWKVFDVMPRTSYLEPR